MTMKYYIDGKEVPGDLGPPAVPMDGQVHMIVTVYEPYGWQGLVPIVTCGADDIEDSPCDDPIADFWAK